MDALITLLDFDVEIVFSLDLVLEVDWNHDHSIFIYFFLSYLSEITDIRLKFTIIAKRWEYGWLYSQPIFSILDQQSYKRFCLLWLKCVNSIFSHSADLYYELGLLFHQGRSHDYCFLLQCPVLIKQTLILHPILKAI